MRTTKALSVTLPIELADMVKAKVESGDYASESEVIREGLRALKERDAAVEEWLRREGVARYDASMVDATRLLSANEARRALDARVSAKKL